MWSVFSRNHPWRNANFGSPSKRSETIQSHGARSMDRDTTMHIYALRKKLLVTKKLLGIAIGLEAF